MFELIKKIIRFQAHVALAVILAAIPGGCGGGSEGTGSASDLVTKVQVVDSTTGAPLAGVRVTIRETGDTAVTDAEGRVTFNTARQGEPFILILDGAANDSFTVQGVNQTTASVEVTLRIGNNGTVVDSDVKINNAPSDDDSGGDGDKKKPKKDGTPDVAPTPEPTDIPDSNIPQQDPGGNGNGNGNGNGGGNATPTPRPPDPDDSTPTPTPTNNPPSGNAPATPTIDPLVLPFNTSNKSSETISGGKDRGAAIFINGNEAVPADNSDRWTKALTLTQEGINLFAISARNEFGGSESAEIQIRRDTQVQEGDVQVESVSSTSVQISVASEEPTICMVSDSSENWLDTSNGFKQSHLLTVEDLSAGTNYQFFVGVVDRAGNVKVILLSATTSAEPPQALVPTGTFALQSQSFVTDTLLINLHGVQMDELGSAGTTDLGFIVYSESMAAPNLVNFVRTNDRGEVLGTQRLESCRRTQYSQSMDLDNDGDKDFIAGCYGSVETGFQIFLNDNGSFIKGGEFKPLGNIANRIKGFVAEDFTADSIPDILAFVEVATISERRRGKMILMKGVGDGTFSKSWEYDMDAGVQFNGTVLTGDFDGDGETDVGFNLFYDGQYRSEHTSEVERPFGYFPGSFISEAGVSAPIIFPGETFPVTTYGFEPAGDIDGDGCDDILTRSFAFDTSTGTTIAAYTVGILWGDRAGSLKRTSIIHEDGSPNNLDGIPAVKWADIDDDGRNDLIALVALNGKPHLQVNFALSNRTFKAPVFTELPDEVKGVWGAKDFNGDNISDLAFVASDASGQTYMVIGYAEKKPAGSF